MGCEWTGKRTLASKIVPWWTEQTGGPAKFHDHFTPPFQVQDNPTTDQRENEQLATLLPTLQEKFQRYQIEYHLRPFVHNDDLLLINHYYGDAVYAPLYYGYGGPGVYGDRRFMARYWDNEMREVFPDTVLVMTKASLERVRQRMRQDPRPKCPITEEDVELVLSRFEEEFNSSLIRRRFALDTTDSTEDETFAEFVRGIGPLLSEKDALRILAHRALTQ
jgi:hypothetical protein